MPDAVVYALPPPMKAPFPQTAQEKRRKVLLSWAPLTGVALVMGAVYVNGIVNPSTSPPKTYTEVPDFLMKSMLKGKADREAAAGAAPVASQQQQPSSGPKQ